VLGENLNHNHVSDTVSALSEQLRTMYIRNYVDTWENALTRFHLSDATSLSQLNALIDNITNNDSPLLQFLQAIYDNTYFEPVSSASPKLLALGALLDKRNNSEILLTQIFTTLRTLHQEIQPVVTATNEEKAAFEMIANMTKNNHSPNVFLQLRLIADKSPEPLKTWLEKISNDSWQLLMHEGNHYLDISWNQQVIRAYQADIANRYPISRNAKKEITLDKFSEFFGNPGVIIDFYHQYLTAFIDTSTPEWRWKLLGNTKLPFSEDTLRQIQHAMRIHDTFFPNGDNKLLVQFSLQPYVFGKNIKSVAFNMNNRLVINDKAGARKSHALTWPGTDNVKTTSVQLLATNQQMINRNFPGYWGWFKLVTQSIDSAVSPKKMVLNLSVNDWTAKYVLSTEGQYNPFLSVNLQHFYLPKKLTETA
ncbi:MAG: ImcF-related family protein, partial [Rickettsiales bacterium]